MENKVPPQKSILFSLAITSLVILALIGAGILLIKKFKNDRQSAMNFEPHVVREFAPTAGPTTTTHTYTQKELEEARKSGKMAPGMPQPYTSTNAAGDAAVQRSMRTLEEINRINEMNRRMTEQQQRNNR